MNEAQHFDNALFERGPPQGLQRRIGIVRDGHPNVVRRAMLVVMVGWLPLIILSVAQVLVLHTSNPITLLWDAGAHARFLIAAPLLVLAEAECGGRLSAVVRNFVDAGMVPDGERKRFDAAVLSTRKLLDSSAAEIVIVALAYLVGVTALRSLPVEQIPTWLTTSGVVPVYSLAGWWHILVSLPLLLILILAWMWRLALWTRLLWLIAQLDLRLLASHPDRAAGLGFLGISVRGFSFVTAAFAAIAAGRSANIVLLGGTLPTRYFILNVSLLVLVVALFIAPLFVFTSKLARVWRNASFKYGALAYRVGSAFEDKWLGADQSAGPVALEKTDFSATTDLYSITANIYAQRFIPIDIRSLIILAGAMIVPFIPVVFLALPTEQILAGLKKLLF